MVPSEGFDRDKKGTEEIAAAVRNEFTKTKPYLMRRLQYYAETKIRYEMDEEIREIHFFLDVMKDEFMVETHGVTQVKNFRSKIYEIDYKHPIPADWIPKTPSAPVSAAYDPSLDLEPEKQERFENFKETGGNERWEEEPTTFSSRQSRNPSRGSQHQYRRGSPRPAAGPSSTTTRDRRESGRRRREQSRSRSRPSSSRTAFGNPTFQQRTQMQPSNELSDWLRRDGNSREGRNHWLNDSSQQNSGQREYTPPAQSFYVLNAPPQPYFHSGPANIYVPGYPYAAPILHIQNIGPNSSTNFFNVPPPSFNQHSNNASWNHIWGRSRSPIRPTSYRSRSRVSAQRMNSARDYERGHINQTARTLPPRGRYITSTNRQQRNKDVPNDMDRDRRHISNNERDRRSKSTARQSLTSRSADNRQRMQNEGLYKPGQREKILEEAQKQREKRSSTDKPNAAASSGSAARETISESKAVEPRKETGKIKASKEHKEAESSNLNGEIAADKKRREEEANESKPVAETEEGCGEIGAGELESGERNGELVEANENEAHTEKELNQELISEMQMQVGAKIKGMQEIYKKMREEGLLPLFKKIMDETEETESGERNGESVEETENETQNEEESNQELNGEMSNDINAHGVLVEKPVPIEIQLEKSPTLENKNGARQNNLHSVASNKNVQPNPDESLATRQLQSVGCNDNSDRNAELETTRLEPIAGPLNQQKSKAHSSAKLISPVEDNSSGKEGECASRYNFRSVNGRSFQKSAKEFLTASRQSQKPAEQNSSKSNVAAESQPGDKAHSAAKLISPVENNTSPAEGEGAPRHNLRSLKRKQHGSAKEFRIISTKSLKPGAKKGRKSNAPTESQPRPSSEKAEEIRIRNIWKKSMKKYTTRSTKSGNTFVGKASFACNVGLGKIKTEGDYIPPPLTLKKENASHSEESTRLHKYKVNRESKNIA